MNHKWYYRRNDETHGPVALEKLQQLLKAREIGQATLLWREGLAEWITVATLSAQLSTKARATPPPPPPPAPPPPPESFPSIELPRIDFANIEAPAVQSSTGQSTTTQSSAAQSTTTQAPTLPLDLSLPTAPQRRTKLPSDDARAPRTGAAKWSGGQAPLLLAAGTLALLVAFLLGWVAHDMLGPATSAKPGELATSAKSCTAGQSRSAKTGEDQPSDGVKVPSVNTREPDDDSLANNVAAPTLTPSEPARSSATARTSDEEPPESPDAKSPPVETVSLTPSAATESPAASELAKAAPAVPASPEANGKTTTSSSPATASESATKQQKSETFFQEIDLQRNPTFSVLGIPTVQKTRYQIVSELRVSPPDANDVRTVQQVVKNARLVEADELSRATFESSLGDLKGWQFIYKLNEQGEVVEWKSAPPDGKQAVEVEIEKAPPTGAKGFMVTSVLDEDAWREIAQLTFFVPNGFSPSGKASAADKRSSRDAKLVRQVKHSFHPLGSWYGETTFTPQKTTKGILQIDYAHKIKHTPPAEGAAATGDVPFTIKDAKFEALTAGGVVYFDTKRKRVQSAQELFRVRGSLTADMLGQSMPVDVEEQQALIVKVLDSSPGW